MEHSSPEVACASPTTGAQRLSGIDVLRGFALCGILLANIHLISGARLTPGIARSAGPLDVFSHHVIALFVDGSFYPLFSLLFGLGLMMQMQRAGERGSPFIPMYLRRIAVLLLIGVAHWILVWDASILLYYALLGFPLLLFRHWSPQWLIAAAALALVLQIGAGPLSSRTTAVLRSWEPTATYLARQTGEMRTQGVEWARRGEARLASGTYGDTVVERAERFARTFTRPAQYYPWAYGSIFAMFLVGLWTARRGILYEPRLHVPLLHSIFRWGLAIGLAGNLLALVSTLWLRPEFGLPPRTAIAAFDRIGGPALGFGYAAGMLLLLEGRRASAVQRWLAPMGRMALTNYLLQSAIAAAIFYGYGLGLYGRTGMLTGLAIAVLILAAQALFSRWWLARFRFGPAEWLWRSLTYGRTQPFRLAAFPDGVSTPAM